MRKQRKLLLALMEALQILAGRKGSVHQKLHLEWIWFDYRLVPTRRCFSNTILTCEMVHLEASISSFNLHSKCEIMCEILHLIISNMIQSGKRKRTKVECNLLSFLDVNPIKSALGLVRAWPAVKDVLPRSSRSVHVCSCIFATYEKEFCSIYCDNEMFTSAPRNEMLVSLQQDAFIMWSAAAMMATWLFPCLTFLHCILQNKWSKQANLTETSVI